MGVKGLNEKHIGEGLDHNNLICITKNYHQGYKKK